MLRDAMEISKAFDLVFEACYNIREYEACEECPLKYRCLEDPEVSVLDYGDTMTPSSWEEFLRYSDHATFSDEELEAQHADFERQMIVDEKTIDEIVERIVGNDR